MRTPSSSRVCPGVAARHRDGQTDRKRTGNAQKFALERVSHKGVVVLSAGFKRLLGMPQNFLTCDREQSFLMPPSLREWLAEDHLAWFVLDVVGELDLAGVLRRIPGGWLGAGGV